MATPLFSSSTRYDFFAFHATMLGGFKTRVFVLVLSTHATNSSTRL